MTVTWQPTSTSSLPLVRLPLSPSPETLDLCMCMALALLRSMHASSMWLCGNAHAGQLLLGPRINMQHGPSREPQGSTV